MAHGRSISGLVILDINVVYLELVQRIPQYRLNIACREHHETTIPSRGGFWLYV